MRAGALVLVVIAACGGGDPAYGGEPDARPDDLDMWCPQGEECTGTPTYWFSIRGTSTSDMRWATLPTVVGGVQTFHLYRLSQPFEPFEVDTPLEVIELAPPDLVIRAGEQGTAAIRVVEPDTELLYSRFEVEARRVGLVETAAPLNGAFERIDPWALVAGVPGQVMVLLYSGNGAERLVDQRLDIAATEVGVSVQQLVWDRAQITASAGGDARLSIAAGDGSVNEVVVPIVDAAAVDDIRVVDPWYTFDELYTYGYYAFCFRAYAGETAVSNLPVTFDFPADFTGIQYAPGCYYFTTELAGTYLLAAHGGDLTVELTVTVH
jgi:hypothetical protein